MILKKTILSLALPLLVAQPVLGKIRSSDFAYMFNTHSSLWSDDVCHRRELINIKNGPTDLQLNGINGPVKKIELVFLLRSKQGYKPVFNVISWYDTDGNLLDRTGSKDNKAIPRSLPQEQSIAVESMAHRKAPLPLFFDLQLPLRATKPGTLTVIFKETRLPGKQSTIRHYIRRVIYAGVVRDKANKRLLYLSTRSAIPYTYSTSYDSALPVLTLSTGRLSNVSSLNSVKKGGTRLYVMDDQDPTRYKLTYRADGRLIKQFADSENPGEIRYKSYRWNNSNQLIEIREKWGGPSEQHYTQQKITKLSYTKSHYTKTVASCKKSVCKTSSKTVGQCYGKRDSYSNPLLRKILIRDAYGKSPRHYQIKVKYHYYKRQ